MTTSFMIQSSDATLLEKATRVAGEFAKKFIRDEIVGIAFLGAIARGYFDRSADIDIAIFKKQGSEIPLTEKFIKMDELEIHIWLSDFESELTASWDMAKRWTFSQGKIFYDPDGEIARLLEVKVPLQLEERKWMVMSGFVLSEWYINRLTDLWVERGNMLSAQHIFHYTQILE